MAHEDLKEKIAAMRGSMNLSEIAPSRSGSGGRSAPTMDHSRINAVSEVIIPEYGTGTSFKVKDFSHEMKSAVLDAAGRGIPQDTHSLGTAVGAALRSCRNASVDSGYTLVMQPGKVGNNEPATWAYLPNDVAAAFIEAQAA